MKNKENSFNSSGLSSDRSALVAPKTAKKVMYGFILLLAVASGLAFANQNIQNTKMPKPKPLSAQQRDAERKKWEASPDGVKFKAWETSPTGKRVSASAAKIKEEINAFIDMDAVVTGLSLPPGSRLGFGIMARINGADYIVNFEAERSQLAQLHNIKVNDKIMVRSRNLSYAPKYAYPIVSAEYAEWDGKEIFKRLPRKGGC